MATTRMNEHFAGQRGVEWTPRCPAQDFRLGLYQKPSSHMPGVGTLHFCIFGIFSFFLIC